MQGLLREKERFPDLELLWATAREVERLKEKEKELASAMAMAMAMVRVTAMVRGPEAGYQR